MKEALIAMVKSTFLDAYNLVVDICPSGNKKLPYLLILMHLGRSWFTGLHESLSSHYPLPCTVI
jgi:hypothetical protein